MPLRDHFHSPWKNENWWEGFHSAWINTMVRHLNGTLLPRRYRAFPTVHLGTRIEADVATFDHEEIFSSSSSAETSSNGGIVATWAPPEPAQTLMVEFPDQDIFEVQIVDDERAARLVAVVELVSPANKDRPENRRTFTAKCAAYLLQQVGVVVVDIVTDRHFNFHQQLLELLDQQTDAAFSDLYAVSYRTAKENGSWQLQTWPASLTIGKPLPTVPLWLTGAFAVPLELEKSYEETCAVLRIA